MTIDLLQIVAESRKLRPNTKRTYTNAVKQWLAFAGTDPSGWTHESCQAFYDHLITRGGVSRRTANTMVTSALGFVFNRAHALHGIVDVTAALNKFKSDTGAERRSMTSAQAQALLAACRGQRLLDLRDQAIATLGLFTGMRRMSLVSVDLTTVHEDQSVVLIPAVLKGGAVYKVPIDPRAWRLTEAYRVALVNARGGLGPLFPSIPISQETPGFVSKIRVGGALSPDGLYKAVALRAQGAGLNKFHPHLFRHTFITWCRLEPHKIEDYLIEVVTGHATNRGLVNTVYTDRAALHVEVARRCYEAIASKLGV